MSTLAFLHSDASAARSAARSPFAAQLAAAGATMTVRDGWAVATSHGDPSAEAAACRSAVGWCDRSQLGKLELQAPAAELERLREAAGFPEPVPGSGAQAGASWWLGLTPTRALVLCAPGDLAELREQLGDAAVDVTAAFAALTLAGPAARETFARFCALDLRPRELPVGGVRPGSVARMPGVVVREGEERFLVLFGAAYAAYFWEVVADAGGRLGGRAVGAGALELVTTEEVGSHA